MDDEPGGIDRFTAPLYRTDEAAGYLGVPRTTFAGWTRGYPSSSHVIQPPVVAALPSGGRGRPVIPFIGLAEGLALAAFRRAGVPLQRIRPALQRIQEEFGLDHALASHRLYTDGAEVLFDYAETDSDADAATAARELVVVRHDQRVFTDVVDQYLRRVDFGGDGYARLIRLPGFRTAEVIVDPARGFGQPIFAHGGARLEDVLALFEAGEPLEVVSEEYGVPPGQIEDVLRVAVRRAA